MSDYTTEEQKMIDYGMSVFAANDRSRLRNKLEQFVFHSDDAEISFNLAYEYFKSGQLAAALSFFLRAAERAEEDLLKYESLLFGALCYEKQGIRKFTVKGLLQQALSVCPNRPEAYLSLSMILEQDYNGDGRWFDAYTIASLGLHHTEDQTELKYYRKYPGRFALYFQKAHTAWHCGLCDDSRDMFQDLNDNWEMDEFYSNIVKINLQRIQKPEDLHRVYTDGL